MTQILFIMNKNNLCFTTMKCKKHNIKLECLGGNSAHIDNWYCSKCVDEKLITNTRYDKEIDELLIQESKSLAVLLTTEPVPDRVKILSSRTAGETITKLIRLIEDE